jgi:hypothetical protein
MAYIPSKKMAAVRASFFYPRLVKNLTIVPVPCHECGTNLRLVTVGLRVL